VLLHLGTDKLCHGDEPPLVGVGVTPKGRFITTNRRIAVGRASCPELGPNLGSTTRSRERLV
jgi:hypothetical protein